MEQGNLGAGPSSQHRFFQLFYWGFRRQMQMGVMQGLGEVAGGSPVSAPYKRDDNSRGSRAVRIHGAVVLICPSALCNAPHLQALTPQPHRKPHLLQLMISV